MPTKILTSPLGRDGSPKLFKFGGGANTIIALDHDASFGYWINAGGGDDTVTGADFAAGTTADDEIGDQVYSDDTLIGGSGSDIISGGLGDDVIYGGEDEQGTDSVKGKTDTLSSLLSGDVFDFVFDSVTSFTGGNDMLYGSDGTADVFTSNTMFGDARSASLGTSTNPTTFTGGDDTLTGGDNANNFLFGDLQSFSSGGTFVGGDDTLIRGDNTLGIPNKINQLVGDLSSIGANGFTSLQGGNDTLIGGAGVIDQMWGDWGRNIDNPNAVGGADTFVIGVGGGMDTIFDFHVVEFTNIDNVDFGDTIELVGFGFTNFSSPSGMWSVNGSGFAVLDLDGTNDGAGDIVTFNGITDFSDLADSFDFT